jgi:hypothetical protein
MNSNFRTLQADYTNGLAVNRNYIENGYFADKNIIGWNRYADAAASSPADGTGGSPNAAFTLTYNTTTPMAHDGQMRLVKDAANRQGHGVSFDFTIDRADQAKPFQIEFDYRVVSGTFAASSTPVTPSDITVWIYDVTNNQLIQPAAHVLDGSVVGQFYTYRGNFQTNANSQNYRIVLHVATTSAVAYTLDFTNFRVSRNVVSQGTVVTDWQSYTPTFNGDYSLGTGGSPRQQFFWRRVGDTAQVRGHIKFGTSGMSAGASLFRFSTPSGLSIDNNKRPSFLSSGFSFSGTSLLGRINNTTYRQIGYVQQDGVSNNFYIEGRTDTGVAFAYNNTSPANIAGGDEIAVELSFPVLGWSSSVSLSSDNDGRIVGAVLTRVAAQNFTDSTPLNIPFTSVSNDTHNGAVNLNSSNAAWIAPISGFYNIHASMTGLTHAGVSFLDTFLAIRVNNVTVAQDRQDTVGRLSRNVSTLVFLNAGASVQCQAYQVSGATRAFEDFRLAISRVSGPAVIASTEKVVASIAATGTRAHNTAFTVIALTSKVIDTHNICDLANSRIVIPVSGIYSVFVYGGYTGVPSAGSVRCAFNIRLNSSNMIQSEFAYGLNDNTAYSDRLSGPSIQQTRRFNAGDIIDVTGTQTRSDNTGNLTLSTFRLEVIKID